MLNRRRAALMDITRDVDNMLSSRSTNNRHTRRRYRSINDNIHADDITVDGRNYFNSVVGEKIPFRMSEYLSYMNSLPVRVANIYPYREFGQTERLMRGKYGNRPYKFRSSRNDVNEAARLYRDMKDYPKYIEHTEDAIEASPTLSRSRSRGSGSRGGRSSGSRSRGGSGYRGGRSSSRRSRRNGRSRRGRHGSTRSR